MVRETPGVDGQNFTITAKMHPLTGAVARDCAQIVADYKSGKRSSLPSQEEITRRNPGVSIDTVASIISRLGLSSTFVDSRKIDRTRIIESPERGIADGSPPHIGISVVFGMQYSANFGNATRES